MKSQATFMWAALGLAGCALDSRADVITDWNTKTSELISEARIGTPPAVRVMAIVQTAAHAAVEAVKGSAPTSLDAAVAAAHLGVLLKLLPVQQASIETAYQAALAPLADGSAKAAGISAGEKAAAQVLAQRSDDSAAASASESYRPHAAAGVYVPTATPAVTQWPQRKPWWMSSAAQFRPAAPPALKSATWARDFNEVKALGGKAASRRSADQTEAARFWDYSLPAIYYGVVQSVALQPGRDVARNARLYAAAAQAMDDGLISIFDAKYHYNFWRPITAIRNADIDGHDGTERDAAWAPLIDTPMHPEYPSAHSVLASAVAVVLKAEVGSAAMPPLATTSATAKGVVRHWSSVDDFVREVGEARIFAGIHYRTSVETGAAMGQRIGELAAKGMQLGRSD